MTEECPSLDHHYCAQCPGGQEKAMARYTDRELKKLCRAVRQEPKKAYKRPVITKYIPVRVIR